MSYTVRNKAIKISFMQTVPGQEFNVANEIEIACENHSLEDYAILKGFGSFDLVFLYEHESFDSVLIEYGPIQNLLKTSRYFAFELEVGLHGDLIKKIREEPLTVISLLKINSGSGEGYYPYEVGAIENIKSELGDENLSVLGTLGWNEIILVSSSNNINDAIRRCFWPTLSGEENIKKTYSFVSLNHDYLPLEQISCIDFEGIRTFFSEQPLYKDEIETVAYPSISITAPPSLHDKVCASWNPRKYQIKQTVGKEDVSVTLRKNISWGEFLSDLICFRVRFKGNIVSTSTTLGREYEGPFEEECVLSEVLADPFLYDYEEMKKLFSDQARNIAGTFNTLKGVLHNSVISDAFLDMKMYPNFIVEDAKGYDPGDIYARRNFAMHASDYIKSGAELRLYGTHGTLDENVGQFTRLRGGVQRPLLAMRYVVRVMLERALIVKRARKGWEWPGFIISSGQQFFHAYEVINAPQETLWSLGDWWALNHEIAHVIIDNLKDIVNMERPEMKLFLAQKNGPDYWFNFAEEVAAEYIGYELGFFGDYELFVDKIWSYLKELSPKEPYFRKLEIYSLRTYLVGVIERLYDKDEIDETQVRDLQWNYQQIVEHIEKIYKVECDHTPEQMETLYRERFFVASNHASLAGEMLPLLQRYHTFASVSKFRPKGEALDEDDYEKFYQKLLRGEVIDEEIKYPERLMYFFLQNKDLPEGEPIPLKANIAAVQSFSNLERKFLYGDA